MGGVPQLDASTYPSQVFWFLCAFSLLYCVVRWVVVPKIEGAIGSRYSRVGGALGSARSICESVQTKLLAQQAALDSANDQARDTVRAALCEVSACMEQARSSLEEEMGNVLKIVAQRLEDLERDSRDELVALAAEVAFMYYSKVRGGDETKRVRLEKLVAKLYGGKL
ncbi:MAG: F0F1 ATP synthase subunit B family protein [Anaplasma sp.]